MELYKFICKDEIEKLFEQKPDEKYSSTKNSYMSGIEKNSYMTKYSLSF